MLLATALGLLALYGTTYEVPGMKHYYPQQVQWCLVSLVVFVLAVAMPYRWFKGIGWAAYGISLVLLALLLIAKRIHPGIVDAVAGGGAMSWFKISVGGTSIRFQPSEYAKITTVIVTAHYLAWRHHKLGNPLECIPPLLLMLVPLVLIFKEPDLGGSVILLPIPFVLLFVAGVRWWMVLTATITGLVLLLGGAFYCANAETIPGLRAYQEARIRVFLTPIAQPFILPGVEETLYRGAGDKKGEAFIQKMTPEEKRKWESEKWNIDQAEMALGSGQIFGKGWCQGTQSRYRFLPEHHTDFIFSSLGEQFGLVGCFTLLFLYALLTFRALLTATRTTDPFGKYLCVGLITLFLTHAFMNIGMSTRLLPVTGCPLPLASYGGSFMVANYLILGLIVNVAMRREENRSMARE